MKGSYSHREFVISIMKSIETNDVQHITRRLPRLVPACGASLLARMLLRDTHIHCSAHSPAVLFVSFPRRIWFHLFTPCDCVVSLKVSVRCAERDGPF